MVTRPEILIGGGTLGRFIFAVKSTLNHVRRLRSLCALNYLEFNRVPFVQGFVSLGYDCAVMDKYIWTIRAPDKAVAMPEKRRRK